jgi:hypothetical protein
MAGAKPPFFIPANENYGGTGVLARATLVWRTFLPTFLFTTETQSHRETASLDHRGRTAIYGRVAVSLITVIPSEAVIFRVRKISQSRGTCFLLAASQA